MTDKSLISALTLVYPPISNQGAEWMRSDKQVIRQMMSSAIYMIARRAEIFFRNHSIEQNPFRFTFELEQNSVTVRKHASLDLTFLADRCPDEEFEIEAGSQLLRIWNSQRSEVLFWCTIESLLMDSARGKLRTTGLGDVRDLMSFELLYVGMSTKQDAFKRLVLDPHEKRVAALSNEFPIRPGARTSDEIFFFFFDLEMLHVSTLSATVEVDDFLNPAMPDRAKVIIDAEQAFISILQAKYNKQIYANYPNAVKGLFDSDLAAYAYVINEDIAFRTDKGEFRGAFGALPNSERPEPPPIDVILISGDEVVVLRQE